MTNMRRCVLLAVVAVLAVNVGWAQGDQGPMFGSWKLNVAKSNFGNGPKVGGLVVQVTSDTPALVKWSTTMTAANGMEFTYTYEAAQDGKDHPAQGTSTTYAYSEDGKTVKETQKDTDGTVTVGTFTVAANGKTGTWTYTITDPQGNVVNQTLVFDRVAATLKTASGQ
jgi:hypothetical protein